MNQQKEVKCWIDGSSSKKLDNSAFCIILQGKGIKRNKSMIIENFEHFMPSGNIELKALEKALTLVPPKTIIYTDRLDITQFINGKKKAPKDFDKIKEFVKLNNIKVLWIKRKKNIAGHYLTYRLKKIKGYGNWYNLKKGRRKWKRHKN